MPCARTCKGLAVIVRVRETATCVALPFALLQSYYERLMQLTGSASPQKKSGDAAQERRQPSEADLLLTSAEDAMRRAAAAVGMPAQQPSQRQQAAAAPAQAAPPRPPSAAARPPALPVAGLPPTAPLAGPIGTKGLLRVSRRLGDRSPSVDPDGGAAAAGDGSPQLPLQAGHGGAPLTPAVGGGEQQDGAALEAVKERLEAALAEKAGMAAQLSQIRAANAALQQDLAEANAAYQVCVCVCVRVRVCVRVCVYLGREKCTWCVLRAHKWLWHIVHVFRLPDVLHLVHAMLPLNPGPACARGHARRLRHVAAWPSSASCRS
jgi:hypothetical protein